MLISISQKFQNRENRMFMWEQVTVEIIKNKEGFQKRVTEILEERKGIKEIMEQFFLKLKENFIRMLQNKNAYLEKTKEKRHMPRIMLGKFHNFNVKNRISNIFRR